VRHFVLDASVALAWFVDDPVATYAIQVRQAILNGRCALVPALWHLEMANGLVVAERRGVLSVADSIRNLGNLEQLVVQALETQGDTVPLRQALSTARAFGLSAYDSVYLDLALKEGLPLATLDRTLRSAAKQAGIELFH